MKYLVPVIVGAAVMTVTITTALATANGAFIGHTPFLPYLYGYGSAVVLLLTAGGIAIFNSKQEQSTPHVVGTRYGQAALGTGLNSHGYQVGESGLIVANHGEPAYEIGVYSAFVVFGSFYLHFSNRIVHLRKEDGESQISTWVDSKKQGGFLGGGLFEIMRQHDIDQVKVPVLYKDIKSRWYKTICTIERDVQHSRNGLVVKSDFRGRAWKPKT
jgi:hypothetical protein